MIVKLRIFLLILSAFFLFEGTGLAQEYITIVKLKDGSIFEGQLLEYKDGEYIKMNLGQSEITIKYESIKTIKHKNLKFSNPYSFKETGFYHHTNLNLMPGYLSAGNGVLGIGIDHTSGYLFNRWIGAGLNLGLNNYNPGSREVIYSLAAEARGYLLPRKISPYYVVRTGYGYAHKGVNFLKASGGFFFNPGIGLRFGTSEIANFMMELGVSFQDAFFVQESSGWWETAVLEKDVRYQRFTMKFGILF